MNQVKKILFLLVFFTSGLSFAQEIEPVSWNASVEKVNDTEYDVVVKAKVVKGWHLYSSKPLDPDVLGPLPTFIDVDTTKSNIKIISDLKESATITEFDKVFEIELSFFDDVATFTQRVKLLDENVNTIYIGIEYQVCDDEKCIYGEDSFTVSLDGSEITEKVATVDERSKALSEQLMLPLKNKELLKKNNGISDNKNGILGIFALGFIGGLLALLTPCVFPMIPLTVSFFTKQSGNRTKGIRNAIAYGFFIVLIYFLLSVPFHFLDSVDPDFLNNISTNIWLNLFFFAIFVFFAFSFFGYYELTLPASWGAKMDSASNVGGLLGIFFMAVTLAIVSFSCTGPILGGLLGSTTLSEGNVATNLSAGMTGFGAALALPFALFALFPNMLQSLPKSGGWLNTVKVILGFLELALALKFLSNADLVGHWGILKREIFIGLWILIFILLSAYTFGFLRFPHDGPKQKLSFSRIAFGILSVAFTIYLVGGLTKTTSLRFLSGFPPPEFYSVVEQENECPLGLNCFKDFDEGLTYAKANDMPIMLDFTGWACVNCRKMEENVWSTPEVYRLLNEEYVLISLYVDDRKELAPDSKFDFIGANGKSRTIGTIGKKWATFQYLNFETASQPFYVLMSPEMELLNNPEQYTDTNTYKNWLEEGLKTFKQ